MGCGRICVTKVEENILDVDINREVKLPSEPEEEVDEGAAQPEKKSPFLILQKIEAISSND